MTASGLPASELRNQLIAAGHLLPLGADGLYGRSHAFEQLVAGLENIVRSADSALSREVTFPPILPLMALERTGYVRSFPDMIGVIATFAGGNSEHADLLASLTDGSDHSWTSQLDIAPASLCSAACHPLFTSLSGQDVGGSTTIQLTGWVFRHEPSIDPARMMAFRQRESVYLGTPEGALSHRERWLEMAGEIFDSLGLRTEAVVANDPFFGRVGRVLASAQRDAAAKWELVFPITGDQPTAIASANLHGPHFGSAFGITSGADVAHTACVGFGVERVAIAVMVQHGTDPADWPDTLRPATGWDTGARR